ncbi:MAG: SOS response-associated peptidase [Actinomycetota bacterium]|nr:SOS response-associated peptidase [Actinomycetota bacterium]
MCASYGLQITAEDAHYAFNTLDERASTEPLQEWLAEFLEQPVKPTGVHARNLNPIVRERRREVEGADGVTGAETRRTIDLAWWKLWVGGQPAKFPAINARVEGLVGSGAWGGPLTSRRALVPATEYYEQGHRFRLDDQPNGLFAFAGLYNVNKTAEGGWMVSYAIITQPASAHIAEIHDRMPLILPPEQYDEWLDPTRVGDQQLLDEMQSASRPLGERLAVAPNR